MYPLSIRPALLLGVASLACVAVAAPKTVAPRTAPAAGALLLKIEDAASSGPIVESIDLSAPGMRGRSPVVTAGGRAVAAQFVPDEPGSTRGTLVVQPPPGGAASLLVRSGGPLPASQPVTGETHEVGNAHYRLLFDRAHGGFPVWITFVGSRRVFSGFKWNDRLYNAATGGFRLQSDPQAALETVSDGPLCTVVRTRARYVNPAGVVPASKPSAVYDWYLWKHAALLSVVARARQATPQAWKEHHFLELHYTDTSFTRFAGDKLPGGAALEATRKSTPFGRWGALLQERDAIAIVGGPSLVYDGRGEYGTYLHAARPPAWEGWDTTSRRMEGWFWIGTGDNNSAAIASAAEALTERPALIVSSPEREETIRRLRAAGLKNAKERRRLYWQAAMSERAVRRGALADADTYGRGSLPSGVSLHMAGDLGLALRRSAGGLRVESLTDLRLGRDLLAGETPPLWTVSLRGPERAEKTLDAASGWKRVEVKEEQTSSARTLTLRWAEPTDPALRDIGVEVRGEADKTASAWRWTFAVRNGGREWGVGRAIFPQVALADSGEQTGVLFPHAAGEVRWNAARSGLSYSGTYPDARTTMQLLAVYHDGGAPTGLYFGLHDPRASYKTFEAKGDPSARSIRLACGHAAPNMNAPGNGFTLSGKAVWQLLPGDWYDAARIYRAWASREAEWWPRTGPDGRADTPLWMRRGPVWAQTGGAIPQVVQATKAMRDFYGVPTALHWYNWHRIPFDNDYPHYFPTKEGFTAGVAELVRSGVYVMPYINGRLWDTRDSGAEDGEFTKRALPYATRTEKDGVLTVHTESYHSKETDGTPVKLAAMCPATAFWQEEMAGITTRLFRDEGVSAVYIDQVAAAAPVLCMDPSHGHPLGGGHWWVESYGKMLRRIRASMPADRMLTTECNAEPYIKDFDGYLTWNWQYDGQVPLFPAVYGGVVQMFGRSYRGGPEKTLAARMKAAQQLAWGEQIGWADPTFLTRGSGAPDFLRRAVRLRERLSRYFYAGEMARPPRLRGHVPTVRADWEWQGSSPVTTDAVIGGSWKLPRERRWVIVLSNVSDSAVRADFDLKAYAPELPAGARIQPVLLDGDAPAPTLKRGVTTLELPPTSIHAWEIRW